MPKAALGQRTKYVDVVWPIQQAQNPALMCYQIFQTGQVLQPRPRLTEASRTTDSGWKLPQSDKG